MPNKIAGFVLALCITAAPGLAQTATELLQKGIFAQETEGNLDNAILIYRQIVNSAPAQRDLAAQAQFRLAQALLQKGDLTTAAQEFDKLARDYADYRNLVSSLSSQGFSKQRIAVAEMRALDLQAKLNEAGGFAGVPPAISALAAMGFDESKPVNVTGKLIAIHMLNPQGAILIEDNQGSRYLFLTASASGMMQMGFDRKTLKPGAAVQVSGVLAVGGQTLERATPARADRIVIDGNTVFDRATLKVPTTDQLAKDQQKQRMLEMMRALTQLNIDLDAMRSQYTESSGPVLTIKNHIAELETQLRGLKKELAEAN